MIVKVLGRKDKCSAKRLINYILKETAHKGGFIITHNVQGEKNAWHLQYAENEKQRLYNYKGANIITHEILSLNGLDSSKVTDAMLQDIARQYIVFRGLQGMFVAAAHKDKDHNHIHFCVSGLEVETGRSFRMSKTEFSRLKHSMESFQRERYPELIHSLVEHTRENKIKVNDREKQIKLRKGVASKRQQMQELSIALLNEAKDLNQLRKLCKEQGIELYERGSKLYGFTSNEGKNYRFKSLGIADHIKELHEKEQLQTERLKELEVIEKGISKEYVEKEIPLALAAEPVIEYIGQDEKESANAEEQAASDTLDPDG